MEYKNIHYKQTQCWACGASVVTVHERNSLFADVKAIKGSVITCYNTTVTLLAFFISPYYVVVTDRSVTYVAV
ncbi:MAG: hypothetical protein LBK00_04180 [Treponema sp.]|nr:hypothetical protein [Treponema sp.]